MFFFNRAQDVLDVLDVELGIVGYFVCSTEVQK